MPRVSQKERLRRELWDLWIYHLAEEEEEDAETLAFLHWGLKEQRYLNPRISVPKSSWMVGILPHYSSQRFRSITRMSKSSFCLLASILERDPVFTNHSTSQQAPVQIQLLLALYKLGQDGSASGYRPSSAFWGVSEGHIFDCTRRVIKAIVKLKDTYIQWPNSDGRSHESLFNLQKRGFLGAVGKIDGTDVVLKYKPGGKFNGEQWFNRKKRYAIDLLGVCDRNKKLTYIYTGASNAQHDSTIFSKTQLYRNPQGFFDRGQYLLGDAAYTNTDYLIAPYKQPLASQKDNSRFNYYHSHIRIDIEHTFGILKGRWKSLTGLRLLLYNHRRYRFAVEWIVTCCILHNFLLQHNDEWAKSEGWWEPDDVEDLADHTQEVSSLERAQVKSGLSKREHIKSLVLQNNR